MLFCEAEHLLYITYLVGVAWQWVYMPHCSLHKAFFPEYEVLSECSRTRSKRKCWLNLFNFGSPLLQNSLFGNIYSNSVVFLHFKSTMEVIFLNAVECRLDVRHCLKILYLQIHFQFGKQNEITGC
jgi:hypothetical protein